MKYLISLQLSIIFSAVFVNHGQASEWGCQVLLCAASSNPSWHGVGSCHPPMEKLISAMNKPGFSWPTCPEGGGGKPGYEKYADCPTGWSPTTGRRGHGVARERSQCMRKVVTCDGGRNTSRFSADRRAELTGNSANSSCIRTEYLPRALRSEPYYFDVKNAATGRPSRFWFQLRK